MANIIILNGASRRNGNTAALIRAITEGAEDAGNQVEEFYLQTMNIHGCMAVCRKMTCLRSIKLLCLLMLWSLHRRFTSGRSVGR